ncbi:hypothetical protein B0T14DRAFT_508643 [Immersiella caudata]|uniref:Uncharacterized protein n=1 Tax=Immersiella caudata TaxID=314043 RepID=A0AA39X237_9PEZI|nr:hypothetical protein B0T14DRAFT_508643 [Immersiella caudata]
MLVTERAVLGRFGAITEENLDPLPPPDDADSNGNTFSRANLVGLFLTLSFCLLTQPPGSLLYPRPRTVLDSITSFFWRLNPLAIAIETLLVLVAFVDAFGRWLWNGIAGRSGESQGLLTRLHITARALHLLRGHWIAKLEEIEPSGWGVSNAQDQRSSPTIGGSPFPPIVLSGDGRQPPYSGESSPASSLDIADRTRVSAAPELSLSPPMTASDLERAMPPGFSRRDRSTSPKRKAVLSRSEFIANIVSTTAMTIVIAKLVSIQVPLHFHVISWLMAASWIAVQVVLLLSYDGNHTDATRNAEERTIDRAFQLRALICHETSWITLFILLIPLLEHLFYLLHFSRSRTPGPPKYLIVQVIMMIYLVMRIAYQLIKTAYIWYCLGRGSLSYQDVYDDITKGLGWQLFGSYLLIIFFITTISADRYVTNPGFWWWCALSFSVFYMVAWCVMFSPLWLNDNRQARSEGLGTHMVWVMVQIGIVAAGCSFAEALDRYDARKTYKPDWLDWLGKF